MFDPRFDIESIKQIREYIDEIYTIATSYCQDNPELFDIIINLTKVAGMYTDVKEQELEHLIEPHNPQEYIEEKLLLAYNQMRLYKRQKIEDSKAKAQTWNFIEKGD